MTSTPAVQCKYIAEAIALAQAQPGVTTTLREQRFLGRGQGYEDVSYGGTRIVLHVDGPEGSFWCSWSRPGGEGSPKWDGHVTWTRFQGQPRDYVVKGSYAVIQHAVVNL